MNRCSQLIVLCVACLTADLPAGDIAGRVRAKGKEGMTAGTSGGQYASRKYKFVERMDYDAMKNFVVFIEGVTNAPASPEEEATKVTTVPRVAQRGAVFTPHVLPILRGTTVEWPNNDDIYHNVFSISDPKPFDLGLYKKGELKAVTFDRAGRVDVFCSIHTSMDCIVLVLENPYFATVDRKSRYVITNVPPGSYTLTAWHERMPSQSVEVTVPEEGTVEADFEMGITGLPQY